MVVVVAGERSGCGCWREEWLWLLEGGVVVVVAGGRSGCGCWRQEWLLWLLEGGVVVVVAFIFHCSAFYFKFISFLDIAETLLTVKQQSINQEKQIFTVKYCCFSCIKQ